MNLLVQRLSRLDSCAVSDALDRVEIDGVIRGLSQLSTNRRIVGEAITVQLARYEGKPAERHLCTAAVEAGGPGNIIVIAHNGCTDAAGWGGILSLAAVTRKIEGIIIDGACRDLDESRELGLPVYGKSAVPITARGRVIEFGWNVAVVVGGAKVVPGDLVIADASGAAVIPAADASQIVTLAETIARRERLMEADIRAGKQVSAVMGATYETMLRKQ